MPLKKNQLDEMLIEQIIEFELKKPGPPGRKCSSTTGYFHDKQKSLSNIFEWIIFYLLLKFCSRRCTLHPPTWTKLQNLTPKCNILNVYWT